MVILRYNQGIKIDVPVQLETARNMRQSGVSTMPEVNSIFIPDGYKYCSRGDNCIHPNGPLLPATTEYFSKSKRGKYGLYSICKECKKKDRYLREKGNPEKTKEQRRVSYQKHAEKKRDYSRKYYHNNKEKMIAYSKNRRQQNIEYFRARDRQYYQEHIEEKRIYRQNRVEIARAHGRKYYQENIEAITDKHKDYYLRNPQIFANAVIRRKMREANLPYDFPQEDEDFMYEYWGHRCAVCGRPRGLWHTLVADHWIAVKDPRPDNPGTVPWNMIPLCHGKDGCNNSKLNKDAHRWLVKRLGKRKAKQIETKIQAYFEIVRHE